MKRFLFFFLLTIGIDQYTKMFATAVQLNAGISFGLFSGSLLTLVLILVLAGITFTFGKTMYVSSQSAYGLFLGGAVSNIFDRIVVGGVRDFLPVPFFGVYNNLADWAIVLSLVWFLLVSRYNTSHGHRKS